LARPFGSSRARLVAVVAYAAVPLPYDALARGRMSGLVGYAVAPWLLLRLARATRIAPFEPANRSTAIEVIALAALTAVASAFAPMVAVVVLVVAAALVGGSLLAGRVAGSWRAAGIALGAVAGAVLLLFPWSADFLLPGRQWAALAGAAPAPAGALSFGDVLRFHTGPVSGGVLGYALLVAAAFPLVVGREWRWAWAARLWVVALAGIGLAWAMGRGWLPVGMTSPDVLLAVAAAALAGAVALGAAAFEFDLPGYRFGWRQAATVIAAGAVVASTLPILAAVPNGRWRAPNNDLVRAASWMPTEAAARGSFRVLWLGDPTVLPLDGWPVGPRRDGLAFGTSRDGPPDLIELWPGSESGATALIADALGTARRGDTSRLGHLLAPMAIRYIVVAERAAPARENEPLRPAPPAVLRALADQVDLKVLPGDPAMHVYENSAWGPLRALLPGATTAPAASAQGADLSGARPVLRAGSSPTSARGDVPPGGGQVLVSEASSRWHLRVAGNAIPGQRAFGWANAYPAPAAGGPARLSFATPLAHRAALLLQLLLWAAVVVILRRDRRLRRQALVPAEGRE
jgi:hypothetical protein